MWIGYTALLDALLMSQNVPDEVQFDAHLFHAAIEALEGVYG